MTVPDPTSAACETRSCGDCDGTATNLLNDRVEACTHHCHRQHYPKGGPRR